MKVNEYKANCQIINYEFKKKDNLSGSKSTNNELPYANSSH